MIGGHALIVDDMLDTGGTSCRAASGCARRRRGADHRLCHPRAAGRSALARANRGSASTASSRPTRCRTPAGAARAPSRSCRPGRWCSAPSPRPVACDDATVGDDPFKSYATAPRIPVASRTLSVPQSEGTVRRATAPRATSARSVAHRRQLGLQPQQQGDPARVVAPTQLREPQPGRQPQLADYRAVLTPHLVAFARPLDRCAGGPAQDPQQSRGRCGFPPMTEKLRRPWPQRRMPATPINDPGLLTRSPSSPGPGRQTAAAAGRGRPAARRGHTVEVLASDATRASAERSGFPIRATAARPRPILASPSSGRPKR